MLWRRLLLPPDGRDAAVLPGTAWPAPEGEGTTRPLVDWTARPTGAPETATAPLQREVIDGGKSSEQERKEKAMQAKGGHVH